MKFIRETSPYIRKNASVTRMMRDVLIALLPITLFAIIQSAIDGNAWDCIYVFIISIVTMLILELLIVLLTHWPSEMKFKELFTKEGFAKVKVLYTANNFTAPLISAIIYALILPIGCDPYIVFIGAFIGMFVGKMVFGGLGSNIFNPAAVGRIFVGVCFPSALSYTGTHGFDAIAGGTPLSIIQTSASDGFAKITNLEFALSKYSLWDLFLGNVPGCMGEVCALLIIISAIYLFIRHSADFRCTLSMLLSFTLVMVVVGLVAYNKADVNPLEFVGYQLLSGGLLFGAVFMITDPVTSPTTKFGRIVYGTLVGVLVAFIRLFGAYPEGVAFSILIGNMFAPVIDYLLRGTAKYNWKQAVGYVVCMAIILVIAGFSVAGGM